MQCPKCQSLDTIGHGKDRIKCYGCGRTSVKWAGSPFYRHRFSAEVIKAVVFWHVYVPASVVQLFVMFLFWKYISVNTVCGWSRKFRDKLPSVAPPVFPHMEKLVKLFADEKFIKINGKRAYWWSVRDELGNLLAVLISWKRDLPSAKTLISAVKNMLDFIGLKAKALITDKLQAYLKAKKKLGRQCKHVRTGIRGTITQIRKGQPPIFITNNISESGNSRIDNYLAKYNYNFTSFKAAQRAAKAYLLSEYTKHKFELWKDQGRHPTMEQHPNKILDIALPTN